LPGHEKDGPRKSLSVNLDRNVFQCFGCGAKGNVIDFIAMMEKHNPRNPQAFQKAAVFAQRKFLYTPQREVSKPKKTTTPKHNAARKRVVNAPLDFELQGLDPDHPWFGERGFTPKTVRHFGAGHCKRGLMKNRIAIPLHDHEGQLIGYAGRLLDTTRVSDDEPLYLLPQDRHRNGASYVFDASAFLYNGNALMRPGKHLVLATDILDVWALWQVGFADAVAVLSEAISFTQADHLINRLDENGTLWILAEDDEANANLCTRTFQMLGSARACRQLKIDSGTGNARSRMERLAEAVESIR